MNRSDSEVVKVLRAALKADSRISSSRIKVSCENGRVELRGKVPTYGSKLAAIVTARETPGVASIADQLEVNPRLKLSDEQVTAYVNSALDAHADIPENSVAVSVKRGRCTLAGSVPTHTVWQTSAEVALACKGVRSVRNLLVVDPESVTRDSELVRQVRYLLRNQEALGLARITVKAVGGRVVLTGWVPSLTRKAQAGRVAGRPAGVRRVINRLRVR